MARLTVIEGEAGASQHPIAEGTTLGRGAHNGIPMPANGGCSRDHAKVWRIGPAQYAVADLGSTNGTLVNGEKTSRTNLEDGDEIRIGHVLFRFDLDDDEKPKPKPKAASSGRDDFAAVLRGDKERPDKPVAASLEGHAAMQIKSRILQYNKKDNKGSQVNWDISQTAGPMRYLLMFGALAICAAIFYVVFKMVSGGG
jgi:pSer/pThr/pTyr-binding forkhead associated (FHA) protein